MAFNKIVLLIIWCGKLLQYILIYILVVKYISCKITILYQTFFYIIELQLIWSQTTIPKSLRECYRNNAILNPRLPLNLRILVDIIQKMEKQSYSITDMRIMSSSILHRSI